MDGITVCSGVWASAQPLAAEQWQALGLPHLLLGESNLAPGPGRQQLPDVAYTSGDQPSLAAALRAAVQHSQSPWVLLLAGDAWLSPAALQNLPQLLRSERANQLVVGRAWRLPLPQLQQPLLLSDQTAVDQALSAGGSLDQPQQLSWVLLPRGCFLHAPPELSCDPAAAAPWLIKQARLLGWPVLEASAAVPLLRPQQPATTASAEPFPSCNQVVLPYEAGRPKLSLLLAAPPERAEALANQLKPAESLPWEVIVRPTTAADGSGYVAAAWNSALAEAQGDLIWPLTQHAPSLALLSVLLKACDAPWVDFIRLAWRLGTHHHSAADSLRLEPGCLLGQQAWFQRSGGFDERLEAGPALQALQAKAALKGAMIKPLDLPAFSL